MVRTMSNSDGIVFAEYGFSFITFVLPNTRAVCLFAWLYIPVHGTTSIRSWRFSMLRVASSDSTIIVTGDNSGGQEGELWCEKDGWNATSTNFSRGTNHPLWVSKWNSTLMKHFISSLSEHSRPPFLPANTARSHRNFPNNSSTLPGAFSFNQGVFIADGRVEKYIPKISYHPTRKIQLLVSVRTKLSIQLWTPFLIRHKIRSRKWTDVSSRETSTSNAIVISCILQYYCTILYCQIFAEI